MINNTHIKYFLLGISCFIPQYYKAQETKTLEEILAPTNPINQSIIDESVFISAEPLKGEADIMLREIQSISQIYTRLPANNKSRIVQLRALLKRLNNIEPNTIFLRAKKRIMEASISFRLNNPEGAYRRIVDVIENTHYLSLREEAARVFIAHTLVRGTEEQIISFIELFSVYFSEDFIAEWNLIFKNPELTAQDASYILNQIVTMPLGQNYPQESSMILLNRIRHKLSPQDIDAVINTYLQESQLSHVLTLMRVRLEMGDIDYEKLYYWGNALGSLEKDLIKVLKEFPENELYTQYLTFYNNRINAVGRGRVYNTKLYRYRGEPKAPYNSEKSEKEFAEYLEGDIEERYVKINTEYAFRNFLAAKQYDKVITYGAAVKEKMWTGYVSPYIDFWHAYSLLESGQTNNTVLTLLGDIVSYDPESYYGMLSQNLLKNLFKDRSFSRFSYFAQKRRDRKTEAGKIRYAYSLYYLGSRMDKIQAEKILQELGMVRPKTKAIISPEKEPLLSTYISLGFYDEARSLIHQDGIANPYFQDALFGTYLVNQNKSKEYQRLVTKRGDVVQRSLSFGIGRQLLTTYYPLPYQDELTLAMNKITNRTIDPYLVYSVMRAESLYKPRALSRAGARGLMQIMPVTGKWLAGRMRIKNYTQHSLYNPEVNIYMGASYLFENIDAMGLIPALAAYNSGPTYVNNLIKKYEPNSDIELAEIHPKRETRDYVRKVMEFYWRYKLIYDNSNADLSSFFKI